MRTIMSVGRAALAAALICGFLSSGSGCIGLASHLLYVIKGEKVPAEFEGLEGKRVAVVCMSGSLGSDPGSATATLARLVEVQLKRNVPKIELVRQQDIANWIDNNDWDRLSYRDIGRGVRADIVLAIELDGYRLHEDQTMYKGRTKWAVTVYDMRQGGEVLFSKKEPNFEFPINGGQHVSETTEEAFQKLFLTVLSHEVSKWFYAYEFKEDFARDALIAR